MDNLVKLQLDNNIITKIQGLTKLVHLKWLDLSFNMIEKIEGLDTLILLEDLSLFDNKISQLEGLESLKNLNVLSVGKNQLEHLDKCVDYLSGLTNKLEVLKFKQNWFKEQGVKEYKGRIVAYLPNLKYLDYELVDDAEREQANQDFRNDMEANKNSIDVGQEKNENEDQLRKELQEAHIESTHNLFINCCRHFEDYPKISSFLKYADIFSTYESHVEEFVTKFQGDIKIKNRKKKEIQKFCLEKMKQAERKAEKESISLIELYKKEEKRVFRALEKQQRDDSQNKIDFGKPEEALKEQISELQANLMDVEIKLQQALTVSKNAFLSQISALNDEMG